MKNQQGNARLPLQTVFAYDDPDPVYDESGIDYQNV